MFNNIKFLIEGEEECGSDNLEKFVIENRKKLNADVIVISDTSIINNQNPSVTVGLRGLSYLEIELTGPNRDLHSGTYGGAVENPINAAFTVSGFLRIFTVTSVITHNNPSEPVINPKKSYPSES